MKTIAVSQDIRLTGGFAEYAIESQRDLELSFTAAADASVLVQIRQAGKIRLRTFTEAGVKVSYLFWNDCDSALEIDEQHEVMQDADFHIAYCETNPADTKRHVYAALRQEGARSRISSASLVSTVKDFDIEAVNFARHTYSDMDHYSVVTEGGHYKMVANGKIVKGASYSENHQTSRSLTFDQKQSSVILPILQIDEDEVEASHAMSVGSIDEDMLYYMMSRGLSRKECVRLISTSYLMPIADTIENKDLQEKLRAELEEKLENYAGR